jgi:hypothetical protein
MAKIRVFEMINLLKKSTDLTPQQWVRLSRVRVPFTNGMWDDGE